MMTVIVEFAAANDVPYYAEFGFVGEKVLLNDFLTSFSRDFLLGDGFGSIRDQTVPFSGCARRDFVQRVDVHQTESAPSALRGFFLSGKAELKFLAKAIVAVDKISETNRGDVFSPQSLKEFE